MLLNTLKEFIYISNSIDTGSCRKESVSLYTSPSRLIRGAIIFIMVCPFPLTVLKTKLSPVYWVIPHALFDFFNFTLLAFGCITWLSIFWVSELLVGSIWAETGRSGKLPISQHASHRWIVGSAVIFKPVIPNPLTIFKTNLYSLPARIFSANSNPSNFTLLA